MTTEKKGCLAFAVCGSFCTLEDALGAAQALTAQGWTLLPVMSFAAQQDTRFGTGESWRQRLQAVTGQPVLDTLLTAKSLYCQQYHITMTCVADGHLLDFLETGEICTIVGTALDNATESVETEPDHEKRLIRVAVYAQNGFVMLRFENYCAQEVELGADGLAALIESSGLRRRQKKALLELAESRGLPKDTLTALAERLLATEEARNARTTSVTDMIAKLGPMFGLLGTLIPLGPGIVALGQGDTVTLSESMNVAFDTTIAGVISAAVASVISHIRKRWYNDDMVSLETLMEAVLEEVTSDVEG